MLPLAGQVGEHIARVIWLFFGSLSQYLMQKAATQSRANPDVRPFFNLAEIKTQLVASDETYSIGLDEYAQGPSYFYFMLASDFATTFLIHQKCAVQSQGQSNAFLFASIERQRGQFVGYVFDFRRPPTLLDQKELQCVCASSKPCRIPSTTTSAKTD
jgi:hypothetical protein